MKNEIKQKAREYYLNEVINGDTCDDKDGWDGQIALSAVRKHLCSCLSATV